MTRLGPHAMRPQSDSPGGDWRLMVQKGETSFGSELKALKVHPAFRGEIAVKSPASRYPKDDRRAPVCD